MFYFSRAWFGTIPADFCHKGCLIVYCLIAVHIGPLAKELSICLQLVWYMYACSVAFLELSCTVFFCDRCYVVSLSECKFCRGLHT